MSPDQPGAAAPRETGGTARFEPDVEEPAARAPSAAPRRHGGPAARRRLLDDPTPPSRRHRRRAKVRARKVRRIVRHIEPWSVLKLSVLFFLSIFLIICVASAVLWNAARSAGAIDDVESFVTSLGFGNCEDIEPDATTTDTTPSTVDGTGEQVSGGTAPPPPWPTPTQEETSTLPDEDGDCARGPAPGGRLQVRGPADLPAPSPSVAWCSCWPARRPASCWRCSSTSSATSPAACA